MSASLASSFAVTNLPHDPVLDLDPWVGQRAETYRFDLIDGVTGEKLAELHPDRGASLSHDAGRTIPRTLNISMGVEDTALVDPLTARVDVYMEFATGDPWPLGRYMFTDESRQQWTSGYLSNTTLVDEMFIVDQEIETGLNAVGRSCQSTIQAIMEQFPFVVDIEPSPFKSRESWPMGTPRGSILQSLALAGDYFNPWFGNDRSLHFVRSFDPATRIPDFDWDRGNKVARDGIIYTSDILTAPNRWIVISTNSENMDNPAIGRSDVPANAPHSIANRGFTIVRTIDLPLNDGIHAQAVAANLAQRETVFERVNLTTAPDPRHDSWQVIRWQGELWLEIAWSLQLEPGGAHTHTLRKGYRA